jgi:hypothetical protein
MAKGMKGVENAGLKYFPSFGDRVGPESEFLRNVVDIQKRN